MQYSGVGVGVGGNFKDGGKHSLKKELIDGQTINSFCVLFPPFFSSLIYLYFL